MEFLKNRALQFLEQADYAYRRGYNELALFDIEQYFQLYAEYLLVGGWGSTRGPIA